MRRKKIRIFVSVSVHSRTPYPEECLPCGIRGPGSSAAADETAPHGNAGDAEKMLFAGLLAAQTVPVG